MTFHFHRYLKGHSCRGSYLLYINLVTFMLVYFGIKLLLVLESDVSLCCCVLSSSNATDNRGLAKSFQFHFLDVL